MLLIPVAHSAGELRAKKVLSLLGVDHFMNSISRVKEQANIEYIDEVDYADKLYMQQKIIWDNFDQDHYYHKLQGLLVNHFNNDELDIILKKLNDPFFVKMMQAASLKRKVFQFYSDGQSRAFKLKRLTRERFKLLSGLFSKMGLVLQQQEYEYRLDQYLDENVIVASFYNFQTKKSELMSKDTLRDRKAFSYDFMVHYHGNEYNEFSKESIDQFMSFLNSKTTTKFVQLVNNFHYFYLMRYVRSLTPTV